MLHGQRGAERPGARAQVAQHEQAHPLEQQQCDLRRSICIQPLKVFGLELVHVEHGPALCGATSPPAIDGNVSLPMRTLFLQEMTRRGILINYVVPSYAHRQADVEQTLLAMRAALDVYSQALINGWERYLVGDVIKPVFREMN